ncbi:hypothetical protein FHS89_001496 [Rubricella aquisinus]|uniref:DUF547 domain-containing protein n=1 Tax=Rubricella aquisinus TaxID=2028108 RepID=A0A840WYL7_9RHOB|nr:DUF547 domain-containing protein [Rubricella aquisinus]MBB5515484.1 hypothetical protein [Rubricella aquisinus]
MYDTTRRTFLALTSAAILAPSVVVAAPASKRIPGPWDQFGGQAAIDNSIWADLLAQHWRMGADGVARFDYANVSVPVLRNYIDVLEATDPTRLTPDAAFAFWVNAYNAVTVWLVAGAMPVDTIRKVNGGLFNTGPWADKVVTIAGARLSLDDIEHGILRPVWQDARVHYAVNCASIGCPNLMGRPWEAATLGPDLDAGARAFATHPRGASVEDGRLVVSSIYEWFKEDFGNTDAGVISHLRQYGAAIPETITRIADDRYDWSLNI